MSDERDVELEIVFHDDMENFDSGTHLLLIAYCDTCRHYWAQMVPKLWQCEWAECPTCDSKCTNVGIYGLEKDEAS